MLQLITSAYSLPSINEPLANGLFLDRLCQIFGDIREKRGDEGWRIGNIVLEVPECAERRCKGA